MIQNAEFIKDFVEEAISHVDALEVGLLKLENGNGDADIIHSIFRNVHSIKGTAGFFGLKNIVSLAHAMENLFGEIRNGNLVIDNKMIDILLAANDSLKTMIADVENSELVNISEHTAKILAFTGNQDEGAPQVEASTGRMSAPEDDRVEVSIADQEKAVIRDAIRRGHRVYKTAVPPGNDQPELFNKIGSIGQIVGSCTENGSIIGLKEQLYPGASFDLLITTVLEKSLLTLALDIPEENIIELNASDVLQGEGYSSPEATSRQPATDSAFSKKIDVEAMNVDFTLTNLPVAEEAEDGSKKHQIVSADDTIRVHITLLNDLLNLASEMVLGRNQLLRILESHRKEIQGLNAVLQNIDGITTELQEKVMQTRMQPVAKVFNKFPRITRELSRKMEKDIELLMEGTEVELDKSIIEALGDPVTHLIRNAADHGIEIPEVREKNGKPRTGTIVLKAYHEGGHVNIDIIDDGAGINVENVKMKALQKGLINPADVSLMGERELLGLLFCPGFSTAEKVTDVSGRGVGMDVVKTNIEKLGGTMEIMTTLGQGTIFRLTLPLTLAIISSLIVEAAGQKFALPQVNLQGMVRLKPGDPSHKIEKIRDSEVLRFRGRLLPIINLADILSLRKTNLNANQIIRVLVIKSGSKRFGLVVDLIHDGEEILVKPLPRYLNDCRCYSGVTIMGDGRTAMILDPEGIAARAGLRFIDENSESATKDTVSAEESMTERQVLLLFKCSGPETFSIDLSMVARVEKINANQIEKIGDKAFIQFRGEALRVIRPENYLPVTRGKKKTQKLYVIIPKLVRYPMGILIEKIHDTIETKIKFNQDDIKAKGLVGSAILDNRIVLFINIYELFEMADPKNHLIEDSGEKTERKRTVLLVEDTPFFIKMEKKYLESAGYQVIAATNGKEAWEMLQEKTVDTVVSDIEMPVMDGLELVKRIRADKRLASLPVVAVTSRGDERSKRRGLEAGFDFYEIKLDKERLLEKISLAFQKRSDTV